MRRVRSAASAAGRPVQGMRYLFRGFRTWSKSPALMGLGLLPGIITVAVFALGLVTLFSRLEPTSDWIARQVAGDSGWQPLLEVVVGLSLLGGAGLLVIYTFTAVTLFVGQPFFERISRDVDGRYPEFAEAEEEPWWRSTARGLGEGIRLLMLSGIIALSMFAIGFIPVIGAVTAFVIGASIGGWFLALELTAYPMARRGIVRLKDRRRLMAQHRPVVVGFGAVIYALALIPGGAVVTMPAAVSGAVLLTRHVLGESMVREQPVNTALEPPPEQ